MSKHNSLHSNTQKNLAKGSQNQVPAYLRQKFSSVDPAKKKEFLDVLRSNKEIADFLIEYLDEHIDANVFTEGYGEERAEADGKAKAFYQMKNFIRGVFYDK